MAWNKYILLDVLVCSIAVYFFELYRILKNTNKEQKYKAILHTKTSSKRFIIQLLYLSVKEGKCDSFACAHRPVRQTYFLLYK